MHFLVGANIDTQPESHIARSTSPCFACSIQLKNSTFYSPNPNPSPCPKPNPSLSITSRGETVVADCHKWSSYRQDQFWRDSNMLYYTCMDMPTKVC